MNRYIVHIGTGTVIDIDDDCYYVNGENIVGDVDSDQDMIDAAINWGTPLPNIIKEEG